jgi:D-alanyl-D-alanine carboxypeptidase
MLLSRLSLASACVILFASPALARSTVSAAGQARSFPGPPLEASASVVMDATNGTVLYARNPHVRRPIASVTKIMTALLALQMGSLTDRIRVPKSAFNYEWDATVMGLKAGEVVTLKDLLYGLLLPSGADAANTIAIHYAGSESRFVQLMNHEAQLLNMHDTHYNDTHGLVAKNNYSSAYDQAILAQYVSYYPVLMAVAGTRYYQWNGRTLTNINHVLFWYPGVDGIKPGFTDEAGICQVLDVRRDGRHIVVSILNTPNLVTDARNLLDFGLQDFSWIQSPMPGETPAITQSGANANGSWTYYPGSGHYVQGRFRTAFASNGGLAAFGFPRTEQLTEGRYRVQYFQNGALSLDSSTGRIARVALGASVTPPPAKPPPKPPAATPTRTPGPPPEGTLAPHLRRAAAHVIATATPTPTSKPRATSTPTSTPKPTPRKPTPTPKPTPRPTTPAGPGTAKVFTGLHGTHARFLGSPTGKPYWVGSYMIQVFDYGALVYDLRSHAVWQLPLGDHVLSARSYLAVHPGNVYPSGFAPASVLKAINWLG